MIAIDIFLLSVKDWNNEILRLIAKYAIGYFMFNLASKGS